MVHPTGVEPVTYASGGHRSIQLSYGWKIRNGILLKASNEYQYLILFVTYIDKFIRGLDIDLIYQLTKSMF